MLDLTGSGIKPSPFRADSDVLNHFANILMLCCIIQRMLIIAGAASFVFGIILEISSLSVHCEAYCPPVWVSQVGAGLWSGMVVTCDNLKRVFRYCLTARMLC